MHYAAAQSLSNPPNPATIGTARPRQEWFFLGLLVVQVFLLLSERFRWFPYNEMKGWTVLIAIGVVFVAVLVMLIWGLVCLLLGRRFQFSFRSLLVFVVVLSVPFGWFAWQMQRARRQREAVEGIVEAGGRVTYEYEMVEDGMPIDPTEAAWLRELLNDDFFYDVVEVNCSQTYFDDDDASHLPELTNLGALRLTGSEVTDKGLAYISGLHELGLLGTRATEEGIKQLQQALPNFQIFHD